MNSVCIKFSGSTVSFAVPEYISSESNLVPEVRTFDIFYSQLMVENKHMT